jgi:hypothetical protein
MSSTYKTDDSTASEGFTSAHDFTASGIKDSAAAAAETAKDKIAAATDTAKDKISAAAEPVADKAREVAEEQKQSGAERIDGVAKAVHTAADEIGKQVPQVAGYIHSGAEQLEKTSRLLRENSIDDLLKMTNRLAHERPLAFIGGSVAAGFVLARFLRTSGSTTADPQQDRRS